MKNLVDSTTKFAPVDMWAKIPMGVTFRGDATSIAVDSEDNVYVFNRGNYPIAVFDKDGDFIRGFGHGDFVRPHGIEIDLDDNIYLVDDDGHFIQKRNNDGEILFTLGEKGKPCKWQSGGMFNRPTDIAIHPINREFRKMHRRIKRSNHGHTISQTAACRTKLSLSKNLLLFCQFLVLLLNLQNKVFFYQPFFQSRNIMELRITLSFFLYS